MGEQSSRTLSNQSEQYLTITEVVSLLQKALHDSVPRMHFEGEISQITRAASGHLYFTLKDSNSQISSVMWRGLAQQLPFKPEQGKTVLCQGKPNIYAASGKLQIIVDRMTLSGEGALQKKFLELRAKLEKEGLFDESRKRTIPFFPRGVGVVTSRAGAAIHDIMIKVRERMPNVQVILADARVQGEGAAREIKRGIERLNQLNEIDVIVVGRGGGSLEDLWAFNEEIVVRAIFASKLPVVVGVGHEVDVTLADLAADVRAPTPTAAAEMVVPRRSDLLDDIAQLFERLSELDRWFYPVMQQVDELTLRLDSRMKSRLEEARLHLRSAEAHLRTIQPEHLLSLLAGRVQVFEGKLLNALQRVIEIFWGRIRDVKARLSTTLTTQQLQGMAAGLDQLELRLSQALKSSCRESQLQLSRLAKQLEALSPRQVLERGFSIVEIGKGQMVTSSRQLSKEDKISLTFAVGSASATVKSKADTNVFDGGTT